jgi:hypothetical protein
MPSKKSTHASLPPPALAGAVPNSVRPIDSALHPIETGSYRIATPAIQSFYELICRCLRYRITGALTYGPPRIGKTRAIEYLRLLLCETHPKITTYHAQAEHKPRHAEGPFFANLLEAVGFPEPDSGSNPTKRMRLINKIKEACSRNGSGVVVLFCDEAQRYDENEYEWLSDTSILMKAFRRPLLSSMSAARLSRLDWLRRRFDWRCCVQSYAVVGSPIYAFVLAACRADITALFTSLVVCAIARCMIVVWRTSVAVAGSPVNTLSRPACSTPLSNVPTADASTAIRQQTSCIVFHGRREIEPPLFGPSLVEKLQKFKGFQPPGR